MFTTLTRTSPAALSLPPPRLPFDTFLIIAVNLPSHSLSRLSRTYSALNYLLENLLNAHFARDAGDILIWASATLSRALSLGTPIPERVSRYRTLLYRAVEDGHTEIIRILFVYGAEVNTMWIHCQAPLLAAVEKRDYGIVRMLLDAGAEVDCRGCWYGSVTPLARAELVEDREMQKILREAGAVIDRRGPVVDMRDRGTSSQYIEST